MSSRRTFSHETARLTGVTGLASFLMFTFFAPSLALASAEHDYVGARKCKTCHKSEAQGEQHPIWLKGAHAKAYEALASDEAKAFAPKPQNPIESYENIQFISD